MIVNNFAESTLVVNKLAEIQNNNDSGVAAAMQTKMPSATRMREVRGGGYGEVDPVISPLQS